MDFIDRSYTFGEEIFNSISHGAGALLSLGGAAVLITFSAIYAGATAIAACSVYSLTLIILYSMSLVYHLISEKHEKAKALFKALDNSSLYLIVAGTYTPYALCCLGGAGGWTLFGVIWLAAVVGIVLTWIFKRARRVVATCYVALGWAIIIALEAFRMSIPTLALIFLILGGALYMGGLVFYNSKNMHYMHSIWHLFVIAGSIFHYFSIFIAVIRI